MMVTLGTVVMVTMDQHHLRRSRAIVVPVQRARAQRACGGKTLDQHDHREPHGQQPQQVGRRGSRVCGKRHLR